jgi:HAD superfamily hydrolase (TIGR01509 family)
MAIKGLIFDFDGLIIDTEAAIYQSWQELYRSYGFEIALKKWAQNIGTADAIFDPTNDLDKLVGRRLDWETIEPARQQRERYLVNQQPLRPGVAEIIKAAKSAGLKVSLASSATCDWVTEHLTRLGLIEYYDCILASDDVRRTKPDPELFLRALACLELQPDQAVVFEDSPNGILAARRAGIFAVAVPCSLTRELPLDKADLRLDSLADLSLEDLLKKIEEIRPPVWLGQTIE